MKKLFGETPQEQLKFLQPRLIITAAAFVISLIGLLFRYEEIAAVIGAVFLMWGWAYLKARFGFVSFAAFLSRNLMFAILILILFLVVGYLFGIVVFIMGLIQYIRLKTSGVQIS